MLLFGMLELFKFSLKFLLQLAIELLLGFNLFFQWLLFTFVKLFPIFCGMLFNVDSRIRFVYCLILLYCAMLE